MNGDNMILKFFKLNEVHDLMQKHLIFFSIDALLTLLEL